MLTRWAAQLGYAGRQPVDRVAPLVAADSDVNALCTPAPADAVSACCLPPPPPAPCVCVSACVHVSVQAAEQWSAVDGVVGHDGVCTRGPDEHTIHSAARTGGMVSHRDRVGGGREGGVHSKAKGLGLEGRVSQRAGGGVPQRSPGGTGDMGLGEGGAAQAERLGWGWMERVALGDMGFEDEGGARGL